MADCKTSQNKRQSFQGMGVHVEGVCDTATESNDTKIAADLNLGALATTTNANRDEQDAAEEEVTEQAEHVGDYTPTDRSRDTTKHSQDQHVRSSEGEDFEPIRRWQAQSPREVPWNNVGHIKSNERKAHSNQACLDKEPAISVVAIQGSTKSRRR